MKRFFRNLLFFVLIAYGVPAVYIHFFPNNFFNNAYPRWDYKRQMAHQRHDPPNDILVMGDSWTMAGVIPRLLSDRAFSFAIGGSSSIECYFLLKTYLEHNPPPREIFLSISPAHFNQHPCFWPQTVKFKFLSIKDTLEIIGRSIEMKSYPWPERHRLDRPSYYYGKYLLSYLNYVPFFRGEMSNAGIFMRRRGNQAEYLKLEANRGQALFGTAEKAQSSWEETEGKPFSEFPTSVLLDSYLEDFLDLCRKNGIKVICESMPINDYYYERMHADYVDQFTAVFRALQEKYPQFVFELAIPHYPLENFGDPGHLNQRGAERFSRYLKHKYFSESAQTPAASSEKTVPSETN